MVRASTRAPGAAAAPRLVAVATAVPPHVVSQGEARDFAAGLFGDLVHADARLLAAFDHACIERRHLCMPLDWLAQDHGFADRNAVYMRSALELADEATRAALARAGLTAGDVDHVLFISSTGLATPSLDAHLANRLGFRPDVRRTPVWGLGCAGGAAGISRARDLALGDPTARVLVIALELCSLTFQPDDRSPRNLIATALFADGAAAAIVAGAKAAVPAHDGPAPLALVASHSALWPGTLDVMGWEITDRSLGVVFSPEVPDVVRRSVCPDLIGFLRRAGPGPDGVRYLALHPGGTKVLRALTRALHRPPDALRHARDVLREFGNMSSPTCLFVLERFLAAGEIEPGSFGVLGAMGPGFGAEFVLFAGGRP